MVEPTKPREIFEITKKGVLLASFTAPIGDDKLTHDEDNLWKFAKRFFNK